MNGSPETKTDLVGLPIAKRPDLKTREEHLQFLKDFAQVKFVYLYHRLLPRLRAGDPASDVPGLHELCGQHTFLVSLTSLHEKAIYEEPTCTNETAWREVLSRIEADWQRGFDKSLDPAALAVEAAARASETLDQEGLFEPRVDRDLADLHSGDLLAQYRRVILYAPQVKTVDTLWCAEGLAEIAPDCRGLEFHIGNAAYPRSFFEDTELIRSSFGYLIDRARELGVEAVYTTTWLNSLPKWNALFPGSWRTHMGPAITEVGPHLGCWGQFISSRQAMNRRMASELFKTGRLPYPMRWSWCRVEELQTVWSGAPDSGILRA